MGSCSSWNRLRDKYLLADMCSIARQRGRHEFLNSTIHPLLRCVSPAWNEFFENRSTNSRYKVTPLPAWVTSIFIVADFMTTTGILCWPLDPSFFGSGSNWSSRALSRSSFSGCWCIWNRSVRSWWLVLWCLGAKSSNRNVKQEGEQRTRAHHWQSSTLRPGRTQGKGISTHDNDCLNVLGKKILCVLIW